MNRMSDRKMIYLDDAIDAFRKALCCGEREYAIGFGGIERILNALPTVEPEITEEAVKDYCRKRCLTFLTNDYFHKFRFRRCRSLDRNSKKNEEHK